MLWDQENWGKYALEVEKVMGVLEAGILGVELGDIGVVTRKSRWLGKKLAECSHKAFAKQVQYNSPQGVPWFDNECRVVKGRIKTGHARCKDLGIPWDLNLRELSNGFKALLRRKRREYYTKLNLELCQTLRGTLRLSGFFLGRIRSSVLYLT